MAEKSERLKNMSEEELNARHAEKMKKKKAARDKIIATKTVEKGLTMIHTGKGKGKSTAAFGMVFRALGNGMRVGVVQFVKGKWGTGERVILEKLGGQVEMATMVKASRGKLRTVPAILKQQGRLGKKPRP